jgi:type II secretory pathway component PulC
MKNKKMLYLLIPGTLIVWGLIIFKIINNMHSEEGPASQHLLAASATVENVSDTFSIHPDYRDPFLGKIIQRTDLSDRPAKINVPVIPVVKAPTPWPTIVYGGIIKNQKLNKEMILLQINGQDFMVKSGETINGIQLFKVFHDSIEVHFSKEKKIIYK